MSHVHAGEMDGDEAHAVSSKNQIQFIIFNEIKDISREISGSWACYEFYNVTFNVVGDEMRNIRWTFIKIDTHFWPVLKQSLIS